MASLANRLGRRKQIEDFGSFLLITYDSCRYDVLRDARTPVLDSYCEIVCAQTPANFTYAAHQAFFVGHLPNAVEPLPVYNRFVCQLLLLAQVGEDGPLREAVVRIRSPQNLIAGLRRHGYQTVGTAAMNWFLQESLTSWFEKFRFIGRDADRQIDYLLSELDPAQPFFAFVNFGETHAPYAYKGKLEQCPVEVQAHRIQWPPVEEGPVGRESPAYAHQIEAAEFLDSRLPRLLAPLPRHTVVVVCADHGDAFGEDGYWGHGVNHPTVLDVPLAVFRLDGAPIV